MRFAAYAGTSVVLAAGTVVRAFFQRANFYSASVQISQSNACLMILTNVALLGVSMAMLGLQRLFYGPLRPIEIEQLYEKAWFAITETCLAMTIFREEVGGWFLVMFVSLLIGKVWGWIGEGRVEILEQQPPANPRLFHAQLSLSLIISSLFDFFMLQYSVNTVLRHARPNMMVMFAFEFAVLTVTSLSTASRYGISLYEMAVIRKQIRERRDDLRRERQRSRDSASREPAQEATASAENSEEDIDAMEIDTQGWEEKGRWIFYLDLATDFFKLVLYITFFCVLCMFYGMPIHIIRDVALTIRSFYKRITDFVRYRQATRDMNARYPDANAEEIAREDVCIICREELHPWSPQSNQNEQGEGNEQNAPASASPDERSRPKKLPCGHILHFACLRSWLERQQICPTCRRPVLVPDAGARTQGPPILHQQDRANPPGTGAQPAVHGQGPNAPLQQNVYQLGPLRIAFGVRRGAPGAQQNNQATASEQEPRAQGADHASRRGLLNRQNLQPRAAPSSSSARISNQLQQIEHQLSREVHELRLQTQQLHLVRALHGELNRLRNFQLGTGVGSAIGLSQASQLPRYSGLPPQIQPTGVAYTGGQQSQILRPNNQHVPTGMVLPEGWTLLPLRQLSANTSEPSQGEPPGGSVLTATASTSAAPISDQNNQEYPNEGDHVAQPHRRLDHSHGTTALPSPATGTTPLPNDPPTPAASTRPIRQDPSTSLPRAESSALPQWGSSTPPLDGQANHDSRVSKMAEPGVESSQASVTSSEGPSATSVQKGKGKATTVEDSVDDVD